MHECLPASVIEGRRRHPFGPEPTPLRERLERRVERADGGCALWTGQKQRGFPIIMIARRMMMASSVVWALAHGGQMPARQLKRTCGRRDCIALAHLVPAPPAAGRKPRPKTNGRLTPADVEDIRAAVVAGATYASLARRFAVHEATVQRAALGKTWRTQGEQL